MGWTPAPRHGAGHRHPVSEEGEAVVAELPRAFARIVLVLCLALHRRDDGPRARAPHEQRQGQAQSEAVGEARSRGAAPQRDVLQRMRFGG